METAQQMVVFVPIKLRQELCHVTVTAQRIHLDGVCWLGDFEG